MINSWKKIYLTLIRICGTRFWNPGEKLIIIILIWIKSNTDDLQFNNLDLIEGLGKPLIPRLRRITILVYRCPIQWHHINIYFSSPTNVFLMKKQTTFLAPEVKCFETELQVGRGLQVSLQNDSTRVWLFDKR